MSANLEALEQQFSAFKAEGLQLDLTRGKPSAAQVSLADRLDGLVGDDFKAEDGTDTRNYGNLEGIGEMRRLGAELLGVQPEQVISFGNSSLTLMYLYVQLGHLFGYGDAASAWTHQGAKFLCPVPGYDRHFGICEQLGIEMINVPMTETGPDMDLVEALVREHQDIRGIWCVPRFSNPTGVTYSDATVERLARLPEIAGDHFRVMWDNAYAVHDFRPGGAALRDILPLAESMGTDDGVALFASASKITHAGSGVAFAAMSQANLQRFMEFLSVMAIGPDKVNQLRHARLFPDLAALHRHMEEHAALVAPKFELTEEILHRDLGNLSLATWNNPDGGYFVSLDVEPGLAAETIRLAAEAGVRLTPAGATFPYGKDPDDRNIRIAPTFPANDELRKALEVLTLCVRLAHARREHAE